MSTIAKGTGLPAAANVEQAILLAQLQILRQLQAQRAWPVTEVFPDARARP
jgi:hypothetical protein